MNTIAVPRAALVWSLFGLRISIGLVFILWTLNKLINPVATARIFEVFYGVSDLTASVSYAIGGLQGLIVLSFLAGFKKRFSIGAVLIMHLVSTLASFERYLEPFTSPNLLFFAAWPMLAGLIMLFVLRDYDTKFSIGEGSAPQTSLNE